MKFLILTEAQAAVVRGETTPGHALMPVPCKEGWMLPVRVLDDPAHAQHHELLNSLPRVETITPIVRPDE